MSEKLKVIFMGTPDFAVPSLKAVHEHHDVIAVITQPDRPKGRGQKLMPSPVKKFALERQLSIYQPEKIKIPEFEAILNNLQPDLIIVVAFGQILSKYILDIPKLGCINVHASLLPYYRGAAPIHWAIINGESKTGVTIMFMDEGLDTGDMILTKEVEITEEMITGELHDKLMDAGATLLLETIEQLQQKTAKRIPQNHAISNYAPLLKKQTEEIDWSLSAVQIHNLVRGLNPWPVARCMFHDKRLKIWQARVYEGSSTEVPGTIVELSKNGFVVATGNGLLEICEIQPANKRRMSAKDYVCGHGIALNDRLE